MIFIKSIEVVEVAYSELEYAILPDGKLDPSILAVREFKLKAEMIEGKRFKTADGREIMIGMTKKVQLAIGLPYEAWEELEGRLEARDNQYKNRLSVFADYMFKVETMSFWKRLKVLFVGYKDD